MSRPSSQITGSPPCSAAGLPWSCQVQEGVMMKSPGAIVTRSPFTAVHAPCPSTMKRSADCVCRWLGATSTGRISCRPAYSDGVMLDFLGCFGFFCFCLCCFVFSVLLLVLVSFLCGCFFVFF